jgi:hypothetical protein
MLGGQSASEAIKDTCVSPASIDKTPEPSQSRTINLRKVAFQVDLPRRIDACPFEKDSRPSDQIATKYRRCGPKSSQGLACPGGSNLFQADFALESRQLHQWGNSSST